MMRLVLGFIAWLVAMNFALTYGGIWNSRANHQPGVTVSLNDGRSLTGELYRNWDNSWILKVADGATVSFDEQGYRGMTFTPQITKIEFLSLWRSWGPVIAVSWLYLVFILWPLRTRFGLVRGE